MSNFDEAIEAVLVHEGNFVNDPHDPGGATKFGISLRWLSSLGQLDQRVADDFNAGVNVAAIQNMTEETAVDLYYIYWWEKYQYEKIEDQGLATKIFDLSVNMGPKSAHICLQRAARAASGGSNPLTEDGILGPKTFTAINDINPIVLLAALRSEAAGYYRKLNNSRYERGWLNRAYS